MQFIERFNEVMASWEEDIDGYHGVIYQRLYPLSIRPQSYSIRWSNTGELRWDTYEQKPDFHRTHDTIDFDTPQTVMALKARKDVVVYPVAARIEEGGRRGETGKIFGPIGEAAEDAVLHLPVASCIRGHGPETMGQRPFQARCQCVTAVEDIAGRYVERPFPGLPVNAFQCQIELSGQPGIDGCEVFPNRSFAMDAINGGSGAKLIFDTPLPAGQYLIEFSDVSQEAICDIAAKAVIQLSSLFFILPFIILMLTDHSKKALLKNVLLSIWVGAISVAVQYIVAKYLGAETPAILGSVAAIVAIIIYAKLFTPKREKRANEKSFSAYETFQAWSVYLFILVFS